MGGRGGPRTVSIKAAFTSAISAPVRRPKRQPGLVHRPNLITENPAPASGDLNATARRHADFAYFRFRKNGYTEADREKLTTHVGSALHMGDVFAYFKHEDTPSGTSWAKQLLNAFSAA